MAQVLLGARRVLERAKRVIVEVHDVDDRLTAVSTLLREAGFRVSVDHAENCGPHNHLVFASRDDTKTAPLKESSLIPDKLGSFNFSYEPPKALS